MNHLLRPRYHADYQRASNEDRPIFAFLQWPEIARLEEEMVYVHSWQ